MSFVCDYLVKLIFPDCEEKSCEAEYNVVVEEEVVRVLLSGHHDPAITPPSLSIKWATPLPPHTPPSQSSP